jgi:hypothetical protein
VPDQDDHLSQPTTNQPLNAPRRSTVKPALVVLIVLALLALGYVAALAWIVE